MIDEFNKFCLNKESYSQIRQDLFVLFALGSESGFFVEFGACDGVYLSNTFLLETYYGWDGILVEPLTYYNRIIKSKRTATVETLCVSDKSNDSVEFIEVSGMPCLSGVSEHIYDGVHEDTIKSEGIPYSVKTISLNDLLDKHNAPQVVDFLSMDTEGSEYSILNSYDFSRKFKVISVEDHNQEAKAKINKLLVSRGYVHVLEAGSAWDSWYVLPEVYEEMINRLGI
jgi:FkbM family methyltransferase